jgi:hypothetical protein
MRFVEIILENSTAKEAKLYNAARKAYQNPEIGITIQNKAAYHVIRDCAGITTRYLAHYVFGCYADPFVELKGKFTRAEIQNFITISENDFVLKQLLDIIIAKGNMQLPDTTIKPTNYEKVEVTDPYGDYGAGHSENVPHTSLAVIDILCELFDVK